MHTITPTPFFLSSILVLTLLPTGAVALRIETIPNASSSSRSSSSSVIQTTGRASGHRAVLRTKRLEWSKRATGNRSLVSSSSSAPVGTFGYQPYKDGVLSKGQESLLYFYGPWSRNSQGMNDVLKKWADDRLFVLPLYRVDFDNAKDLRATYGVKYVNSYVHVNGKGTLLKLIRDPQEAAVKALLYND